MQRTDQDLTPTEMAAWAGLLRTHAALVRQLDHDLQRRHGLPLHDYEVLLWLARAEHGRLRMSDLADRVLLSQSGLTRLVDRLERDGLVARERCDEDRRGLFARLTDEGRERFETARATHLDDVRARFLSLLSPQEVDVLAEVWGRVAGGAPACGPDSEPDPSE